MHDELLRLVVVGGSGLHLHGVVAVAQLRQPEAAHILELVDAGEQIVVALRAQLEHRAAEQVELRTNQR